MTALLADLVVYAHFLYVLFAVGGLAAILAGWAAGWAFTRRPALRLAHLASVVLVAVEAGAGLACPLTVWEYRLRRLAGQSAAEAIPFMARLVRRVMFYDFPAWVFTATYVLFALLVAALLVLYPPRRAAPRRRGE